MNGTMLGTGETKVKKLSLTLWNSLFHGRNEARRNDYNTTVMSAISSAAIGAPG